MASPMLTPTVIVPFDSGPVLLFCSLYHRCCHVYSLSADAAKLPTQL